MAFKKGKSGNPRGRPAGVPNKLTKSAKEAFLFAFDKIGGAEGLARWAKRSPKQFYKLFARLISERTLEIPHEQNFEIIIGPTSTTKELSTKLVHLLKDYMRPDEAAAVAHDLIKGNEIGSDEHS